MLREEGTYLHLCLHLRGPQLVRHSSEHLPREHAVPAAHFVSQWFAGARLLVSPLESSVSFEINLTFVPETDLSMQMLHREKRRCEKGQRNRT